MTTTQERLYEQDFYAWARGQAKALRRLAATRPNEEVDWPRLIEEVDGLAKGERDAVRSQIRRILEHLAKLEFSPARGPRVGWVETIIDARSVLGDKLTRTLRRDLVSRLGRLYGEAARLAARTMRLYGENEAATALPEACPYTLAQVLDPDWFPKSRHGLPDIP